MPDPFVASLGRVSGPLLSDNLLRHGVDLAFDTDLLYIKVSPVTTGTVGSPEYDDRDPNLGKPNSTSSPASGIGINTDVPVFDLDARTTMRTIGMLAVPGTATIGSISLVNNTFSTTSVTPINLRSTAHDPIYFHDRLRTTGLDLNDNIISSLSNQNIRLDPSGSGTVELQANTSITGNLAVSGNITITGNLSKQGSLILGDDVIDGEGSAPENDRVDFNAPFSQDLNPGITNTFELGRSPEDSSGRRWRAAYAPDWTPITTLRPDNAVISEQTFIGGGKVTGQPRILGSQSNEDINILPDTGITFIEQTKWQDDTLTNLLNTPLTFRSTGIGYTRFMGDNGFVIPAGTDAERRGSPEVGETRWSTDQQYLECFDGTVWAVSTGGGIEVTQPIMNDLGNVYTLILG